MTKVAVFVPNLTGGGAERVMLTLAEGFADRGMDTDLVLINASGDYIDEVPDSVNLVDLRSRRAHTAIPGFSLYLLRRRPQVVVSTLPGANLLALGGKVVMGGFVRVVVRIENNYSERLAHGRLRQRFLWWLLRGFLPLADAIVTVSNGVQDDLATLAPHAAHKMVTIYNPTFSPRNVELADVDPDHPWLSQDHEVPVVLAAGRLMWVKDHATLLRAFAQLRTWMPARLVILGEGPESNQLQSLARALGVSDHVDMLGFVPNPFAYMARADVFALPSLYEGFPNVLVQAMSCGTSVVSTDCRSGPDEILKSGELGHLVPVGDWLEMANALREALKHPHPAEELVARASIFNLTASVGDYLDVMLNR